MNTSSMAVSIGLVFIGIVGIALAILMLLGKIPRNHFYGFRTRLSLSSDEIWYHSNRFSGKCFIFWAAINLLIGIISFWLHPLSDKLQLLLVIPPLSAFVPCLISYWWMKKKFSETEQGAAANP
jgi:hypothetical protein